MRRRDVHKYAVAVGLAAVTHSLAGCAGPSAAEKPRPKARYAAPLTLAAAPSYIADAKQFWAAEGLEVELSLFDSGRQALDALLGGQADFMSVSETPPMTAAAQGREIYWIGTSARHHEAKFTYRTDKVADPSRLEGTVLASQPGTNSDYLMYRWLEQHGTDESRVQVLPMTAPEMVQALIQGDVDGIFAWEPHNYNAYSRLGKQAASVIDTPYRGYHCLIATPAMTEPAGVDVSTKFLRGLQRAERFIISDPEESKKIIQGVTRMDRASLDLLWPEYEYRVELPNDLADLLSEQANWLRNSGKISGEVPDFSRNIWNDAVAQLA